MPHTQFNTLFLEHHPSKKTFSDEKINNLYRTDESHMSDSPDYAIYYQDDMSEEQTQFFKEQYTNLISLIVDWCRQQGILDESSREEKSFLDGYIQRLFENYYQSDSRHLFEAKKSWECIWLALNKEGIPLSIRKSELISLQQGLNVCAPGIRTNISMAEEKLLSHLSQENFLQNLKVQLIKTLIIAHLSQTNVRYNTNFEIHFVNGCINYLAEKYGLERIEDRYIAQSNVTSDTLLSIAEMLEERFTPNVLIDHLYGALLSEFQKFYNDFTKIVEEYSKEDDGRLDCGPEFNTELLNNIAVWNARFSNFLELTPHNLISFDDNGSMLLQPLNSAWVKSEVARRFSRQYLLNSYELEGLIKEDTKAFFCNGTYWIEQNDEIRTLTTKDCEDVLKNKVRDDDAVKISLIALNDSVGKEETKSLKTRFKSYSLNNEHIQYALNQGLKTIVRQYVFSILRSSPQTLRAFDIKDENGANLLCYLARHNENDLIKRAVVRKGQALNTEQLSSFPTSGKHAGKNAVWWLARQHQFKLLEKLLNEELLSKESLSAAPAKGKNKDINTVFLLAGNQQFQLLDKLLDQGLLNKANLAAAVTQGVDKGKNVVWLLVANQQFQLLAKLLDQDLLSRESLLAVASAEITIGKNVVWTLACCEQFDLLEKLLDQRLLTKESLVAAPAEGNNKGMNAVWLLVANKQFQLLAKLLNQGLLTRESLISSPDKGKNKDINSVWILANGQRFQFLAKLLGQGLLSKESLSAAPAEGKDKGINTVWILAAKQQFQLLAKLLDQDLLTKESLVAAPDNGKGTNAVWFLASKQQFPLLAKLLGQGLLSKECLAATPVEGINKGKNIVWFLAVNRQFELLAKLLGQGLLIKESLASAPVEGNNKDINTVWALAKIQQYQLLDMLIDQGLLSKESLAAAPAEGENKGVNVVWLLTVNRQFQLLDKLLSQGLLSKESLAFTPHGGKGINVVWLLAVKQQFHLLKKLLGQGLLTKESLAAAPSEGINKGKNALWLLMGQKDRDSIINSILSKGLVTKDALLSQPAHATSSKNTAQLLRPFFLRQIKKYYEERFNAMSIEELSNIYSEQQNPAKCKESHPELVFPFDEMFPNIKALLSDDIEHFECLSFFVTEPRHSFSELYQVANLEETLRQAINNKTIQQNNHLKEEKAQETSYTVKSPHAFFASKNASGKRKRVDDNLLNNQYIQKKRKVDNSLSTSILFDRV